MKEYKAQKMIVKDLNISKEIENYSSKYGFWRYIVENYKLTSELIEKYKDFLPWTYLVISQSLEDKTIKKFCNYIDKYGCWNDMTLFQVVNEDIILEFFDRFNISSLVLRQKFPKSLINTSFINKLIDIGVFDGFICNQILSEEFIEEYFDIIPRDYILRNQRITPYIRKKFNIDENDKRDLKLLKENLLYQTDIGKDWFIDIIYKSFLLNTRVTLMDTKFKNLPKYFNSTKLSKVGIKYSDLCTTNSILEKDTIILKVFNNNTNYFKR